MGYEEYKQHMANKYRARIKEARWWLGDKCWRCGATENLEFDHIDASKKSFGIGSGYARKDFWNEVEKCQLLCSPCHRKKSIECGDIPSAISPNDGVHGTGHMYNKGCRCGICKGWRRLSRRGDIRYSDINLVDIKDIPSRLKGYRVHGTYSMYKYETRNGIPTCEECRKANSDYMRGRYNRKKAVNG